MASAQILNYGGIPHINVFINFHKPLEVSAREELEAIDLGMQHKMTAAQLVRSRENITSSIDFLAMKIEASPGTTQALSVLKATMEKHLATLGGRVERAPIPKPEAPSLCDILLVPALMAVVAFGTYFLTTYSR